MNGYDLIVIGASWGGLRALETLLGGLPERFSPPIAVAQHRAAGSDPRAIAAMLGRHSRLPIREPGDKEAIEPGHVYLAPPDYHLLVEPDGFALSTDIAVQYSRPSIDVLFESAADAYGSRLAAVILTGANQDGAGGIERVRAHGGVTVAQDPETAQRPEMPAAAIATGAVDHVLPLAEIAPLLARIAGQSRSAA